ncbi:MAG: J domain-containing protein [Haloarculaceae archaeon]
MDYDRLIRGVAAALGATTVVFVVLAFAYNLVLLFVALTFGAATFLMYDQISGRMARRVYARVEQQARRNRADGPGRGGRSGFGAGPRADWEPPRGGQRARAAGGRTNRARSRAGGGRSGGGSRRRRQAGDRLSAAEAYRRLGLEPGADQSAVKAAYRERVKAVHPDTDGGDEERFKRVKEAYERLAD